MHHCNKNQPGRGRDQDRDQPLLEMIEGAQHNVLASAHFPKFVLHCRATVHELRKVMGTSKSMILVPLSI
jgi:hypothetical protein